MEEGLVSIVMPTYNCADYIGVTLQSVLAQTYEMWELIIIDDVSTDHTKKVVEEFAEQDKRIRYVKLEKNSGAAVARNRGIEEARGDYIAFLDSDDLWKKDKLEKQVRFMQEHQYAFTFTSYDLIDEVGNKLNKCVEVPEKIDYDTLLYNTPIFTSAVMYDKKQLNDVRMPMLKRGQDVATWLQMLKKVPYAYGIKESLVFYRIRENSLSTGIMTKLKRRWKIYREIEKLPFMKASRFYIKYLFCVIRKRKRME